AARDRLVPQIREEMRGDTSDELTAKLDGICRPVAPMRRPDDLFDDPDVYDGEGLAETILTNGTVTELPTLHIALDCKRPSQSFTMPEPGADVQETLAALGYDDETIKELLSSATVG